MNIFQALAINYQKLKRHFGRALYLVLPMSLIMLLSVVVSSQVVNFGAAADASIFGTVEEQSRLLEIKQASVGFEMGSGGVHFGRGGGFDQQEAYTDSDLARILAMEHVVTAEINRALPLSGVTADLFENAEVTIPQLIGLDSELAALYTDQDFEYVAGEPIPIVLNAATFQELYEDWAGQESMTITFQRGQFAPGSGSGETRAAMEAQSPIKTRAIDYAKDSLLGQEFTIDFGGLSAFQTFEIIPSQSGITFTKVSAESIADQEAARREAIAPYWDYDALGAPQVYTFKVVGVMDTEGNSSTYVPAAFASQLLGDMMTHQKAARTETEIPSGYLTNDFVGLTYDGVSLSSNSFAVGGFRLMGGLGGGMGARPEESGEETTPVVSYTIPGLVIETDRTAEGATAVIGMVEQSDLWDTLPRSGTTILVKIDDVVNRESVVDALNDAGYAYQDTSDVAVFEKLQSTLSTVSTWLMIGFILFTALIITFTMGKFVSESRREIGVFRAMGVTKGGIHLLFVSQAVLYVGVGAALGILAGVLAVRGLAVPFEAWFGALIGDTIQESFNVVNPVASSVFGVINWMAILTYSAALGVITLVIAWLPASRAAAISPVEAIRGE